MLSYFIRGRRSFPARYLDRLLQTIDPQGFLRPISTAEWLGSLQRFKAALISYRLLRPQDCDARPLSERLLEIRDTADLVTLLQEFPRSFETNNEFGLAVRLLSAPERLKFERRLHRLILESWDSTKRRRSVELASAILARMADRSMTHDGFSKLLKSESAWGDPTLVRIVEPLCFVGIHHGDMDAFVKNITLAIDDPVRRQIEHGIQVDYYGGVVPAAWNINSHLRTRDPHIGAHDVGRAISVYPKLLNDPHTLDLAVSLKDGILRSLKELGVGTSLRRRTESLMTA
jgi:hypothetical protein